MVSLCPADKVDEADQGNYSGGAVACPSPFDRQVETLRGDKDITGGYHCHKQCRHERDYIAKACMALSIEEDCACP